MASVKFEQPRATCGFSRLDHRSSTGTGRMPGHLRVPLCFLTRSRYGKDLPKFDLFSGEKIKKNWSLMKFRDWTPAIHLDNRYRLMRGEPMLDADGKETDQVGEDPCAPPSPQQMMKIMEEKGEDYFAPKIVI